MVETCPTTYRSHLATILLLCHCNPYHSLNCRTGTCFDLYSKYLYYHYKFRSLVYIDLQKLKMGLLGFSLVLLPSGKGSHLHMSYSKHKVECQQNNIDLEHLVAHLMIPNTMNYTGSNSHTSLNLVLYPLYLGSCRHKTHRKSKIKICK